MRKKDLLSLVPATNTARLRTSSNFLIGKRPFLAKYNFIEDLVVCEDETPTPELGGFIHHFTVVRNAILRQLWSNGVLIGPSVVENILYSSISNAVVVDPVAEVYDRITDFGLHLPGFILYPLHSFGIAGLGLLGFMSGKKLSYIDKKAGIAITPQVNKEKGLIEFINSSTKSLRMHRRLPQDTLAHYLRGSVLKWLLRNPLLLLKCRTFSGEYYENQFLLVIKLKLATTLVTMLYGMQNKSKVARVYSTSAVNNFETLDIKHYLVFQVDSNRRQRFTARRIPMNLRRSELAEISELNIEINPLTWQRRSALAARLVTAFKTFERDYMAKCVGVTSETMTTRVFRKTFMALEYFKRSFHNSSKKEDSIVNLAVAFETLLTDHYFSPTHDITERLKILLKGIKGSKGMISAVRKLYKLRNECVHSGISSAAPKWRRCYFAFAYSFLRLTAKFPRLATIAPTSNPIMAIIKR